MSAAERIEQTLIHTPVSLDSYIETLCEYGEAMVEAVVAGVTAPTLDCTVGYTGARDERRHPAMGMCACFDQN